MKANLSILHQQILLGLVLGGCRSEPIKLTESVVIRALAYNEDLSDMAELPSTVELNLLPTYTLKVRTPAKGAIRGEPATGPYIQGTKVTLTATPEAGWQFMKWSGDAAGSDLVKTVTMDRNRSIRGIFGTTIKTSRIGKGTIELSPADQLHAYGSTVQVMAVPEEGSRLVKWGGDLSGERGPELRAGT